MKARKVWHVISNRWYSAITAYAINAAKALELCDYQCIFSPLRNSPGEAKAIECQLDTLSFLSFGIRNIGAFINTFKSISPEFIILYGGQEEFLCKFLPRNSNLKIIRFQGCALKSKSFKFPRLFAFSHAHLSCLISPSEKLSASINSLGKTPQVSTIQLGIDTRQFQPHPKARPFDRTRRAEILIFGRLDPVKGHAEFIKIFSKLLKIWEPTTKLPLPCLHVVGLPANITRSQLEREVKGNMLSLGKDVIITCSKVADPSLLLSNASLGAVPSLDSEEICRVAQEFLLCGTPVFVSGAGALEEVLFEGAGESYKDKPDADIVLQLKKLLEKSMTETLISRELRATLAKRLFSLNSMGLNLNNLLEKLTQ